MIKSIPLMKASIKSFVRNWKAIFLLVVVPLVLVGLIFASFNPLGLQKIPLGVVMNTDFDVAALKDVASYFAYITQFDDLDGCFGSLKHYNQYACIEVLYQNSYLLNVHFDNTREPVIWEIIARIEKSIEYLQKERSKEMATDFLTKMKDTMHKVDAFRTELSATTSKIDIYVDQVEDNKQKLGRANSDLDQTLDDMDRDIRDAKDEVSSAERQKNNFRNEAYDSLNNAQNTVNSIPLLLEANLINSKINDIRSQVYDYDREATEDLNDIRSRISNYEVASSKGRGHMVELSRATTELNSIKAELMK